MEGENLALIDVKSTSRVRQPTLCFGTIPNDKYVISNILKTLFFMPLI